MRSGRLPRGITSGPGKTSEESVRQAMQPVSRRPDDDVPWSTLPTRTSDAFVKRPEPAADTRSTSRETSVTDPATRRRARRPGHRRDPAVTHPTKLAAAGAALCLALLGGCATGHVNPADRDTQRCLRRRLGRLRSAVRGRAAWTCRATGTRAATWEPVRAVPERRRRPDPARQARGPDAGVDGRRLPDRRDHRHGPHDGGARMPGNAKNVMVFTGNLAGGRSARPVRPLRREPQGVRLQRADPLPPPGRVRTPECRTRWWTRERTP